MQAIPEDRTGQPARNKSWILLGLALLLIAGIAWYVISRQQEPPAPITELVELPAEEPEAFKPGPDMTPTLPSVTDDLPSLEPTEAQATTVELPTLDDSDPLMQEHIAALTDKADLLSWLKPEHIIRRGVTVVNGLGDGAVLTKLLSVPAPKGKFVAQKRGEETWRLDTENYSRYNYLISVITSIDAKTLAQLYHQLQPLLEEAYAELGYPEGDLDITVMKALDQILAAPVIRYPIELKLESVAYTFADDELEKLPPIQKALIRMGPENTEIIQQKVRELRNALLKRNGVIG